jgi:hypothetical protein
MVDWRTRSLYFDRTTVLPVSVFPDSYDGAGFVLVVYLATAIGGQDSPTPESQEARLLSLADIPWQHPAFPSTRDALADYYRLNGVDYAGR